MKLGVFSVCLPEYNIEESAKLLSEIGYDGVEWRVAEVKEPTEEQLETLNPDSKNYSYRYWAGANKSTLDFNNIAEEARRAKEICDRYGLEIFGLTGYTGADDLDGLETILAAAKDIGTDLVRVGLVNYNAAEADLPYPEAFEKFRENLKEIEQRAASYDVKVVIELHMDTLTASPSSAVRALEGLNPDHIGVTFDPGNMVNEGFEEYLKSFQMLGDYLAHVHVKNSILVEDGVDELGAKKWKREFCGLKDGMADLKKLIADLRRVDYTGKLSVEDFSNELTTAEKLRSNYEYIHQLLDATK